MVGCMSVMELLCVCLSALGITGFCAAGMHSIKSLNAFERSIGRYDYVVVFVYDQKKGDDLTSLKRIDDMFERLSDKSDYADARVVFLKVHKKNVIDIEQDYALSELPAFFILKKGRLLGNDSSRAVLYGYPTRLELSNFIDEWIGSEIDVLVQAEKDRREREQDRQSSNVSINYGIGFGWGGPSYYWDWPYYRPGYYGGWGYHGHRHHGHRHHR